MMLEMLGVWVVVLNLTQAPADPAEKSPPEPAAVAKPKTPRRLTEIESLLGRPPSTELLWRVLERDLSYGLIDEARTRLQALMAREDLTDAKILELREKYGPGLLIRLQAHPEIAAEAKPLLERLIKASADQSRDPKRINYFIAKLDDSASERAYALQQLALSGPHAIPYFVDALRNGSIDEASLVRGLMQMPKASWPAVAAIIDSRDEGLISLAVDVLTKMAVPRSAEYLWFVAGNPKYSQELRERARKALAFLTSATTDRLPGPAVALVAVADRYDRRQHDLGEPHESIEVWRWNENNVSAVTMPVWQAEEYHALRAVQQALELDPTNREAKLTFLNIAFEKAVQRQGIQQQLPQGAEGALETALAAGPDLVVEVLARAIRDRRTAVALSAVRSAAQTASPNLINGRSGEKSPLIAALDYPNSRVRFDAALTALELHPTRGFEEAPRVVQSLTQALDPSARPLVVIADGDSSRANEMGGVFRALGYEPMVAATGREALRIATEAGNVELLTIDPEIREGDLMDTLGAFDKDPRVRGVPTIVWGRESLSEDQVSQLRERSHLAILPSLTDSAKLAEAINAALPDRSLIPWTEEERKANRARSLEWLGRIARGELSYLDATPAIEPLAKLLLDPEHGPQAAAALAYLPGAQSQGALAHAALDGSLEPAHRAALASALARNLQRHKREIDDETIKRLMSAGESETDAALRRSFAAVIGTIDRAGQTAAPRFQRYKPDVE